MNTWSDALKYQYQYKFYHDIGRRLSVPHPSMSANRYCHVLISDEKPEQIKHTLSSIQKELDSSPPRRWRTSAYIDSSLVPRHITPGSYVFDPERPNCLDHSCPHIPNVNDRKGLMFPCGCLSVRVTLAKKRTSSYWFTVDGDVNTTIFIRCLHALAGTPYVKQQMTIETDCLYLTPYPLIYSKRDEYEDIEPLPVDEKETLPLPVDEKETLPLPVDEKGALPLPVDEKGALNTEGEIDGDFMDVDLVDLSDIDFSDTDFDFSDTDFADIMGLEDNDCTLRCPQEKDNLSIISIPSFSSSISSFSSDRIIELQDDDLLSVEEDTCSFGFLDRSEEDTCSFGSLMDLDILDLSGDEDTKLWWDVQYPFVERRIRYVAPDLVRRIAKSDFEVCDKDYDEVVLVPMFAVYMEMLRCGEAVTFNLVFDKVLSECFQRVRRNANEKYKIRRLWERALASGMLPPERYIADTLSDLTEKVVKILTANSKPISRLLKGSTDRVVEAIIRVTDELDVQRTMISPQMLIAFGILLYVKRVTSRNYKSIYRTLLPKLARVLYIESSFIRLQYEMHCIKRLNTQILFKNRGCTHSHESDVI